MAATINKIEVDHEIAAKQQEQYMIKNKRDQDTYETKTIDDSSRSIIRQQQEFIKTKKDNITKMKQFKMTQDEKHLALNRTIKQAEQEYQEEYKRADQRCTLDLGEQDKLKEYKALQYEEEITQLKKNQDLSMKTKEQALAFKQQDFDLIRQKMSD